jgi:predicted dehydrogenase
MKQFKLAFIGAGNRANQVHYPAFADLPDVSIAAVCDIDPSRLKDTADRYGVAPEARYGDSVYAYRDMLRDIKPDGVAAIGNPEEMINIWRWCLENGFNLYIEKPMGLSLHQAQVLEALARRNGCVAAVALQRRATPVVMKLRDECMKRGPITHAMVRFYKCAPSDFLESRDHMMDDCVHSIDTLRWVCGGEAVRVSSVTRRVNTVDINYISATIEFNNGALGYLINSWTSGRRVFDIEMHAPGVCAEAEHETGGTLFADGDTKGVCYSAADCAGDERFEVYTGVKNLARDFIDCCRDRTRTPIAGFASTLKTMELAETILAQSILREKGFKE